VVIDVVGSGRRISDRELLPMLKTVRDACGLHPMALEYAMSEQIEHLSQLLDEHERDAEAFFDKNYVTHGMRELLRGGLQRLAGQSDQATFELRQAMGGGKTHSMLALGLLARNPHLRHFAPEDVTAGIDVPLTKVVAINGRAISDEIYIWGEIASQLDKRELFARFWRDVPKAPTEPDWIQLIGDEPVLILLDELPPYFEYAQTRQVGGGTLAQVVTFALSNLLAAALKLPRCCIVISSLSGTYQTATAQLRQAIRNFEHEANRQARTLTPVDLASDEIYAILKKRLFRQLPTKDVIDAVAASYAEALTEAVRSRSVAKTAQQIVDEIHLSYPFHPSVKHVVALFKENEAYRQTRGLMQFVSKMLKSVWQRPTNNVHLIGCQHLDLNVPDVREEVTRISALQGAIATDIAAGGQAHAELIDAHAGNDAASQAAALLLTASLSESVEAVKGLNERFTSSQIGP
jgi:predicted AAA+ superfamily ATPase